jgi:hypothetical protein
MLSPLDSKGRDSQSAIDRLAQVRYPDDEIRLALAMARPEL